MKDVTRPDDARFLKSRGEPLNTPVEDRTPTPEFNTHWAKLTRAYDEFMFAMHQNSGQRPTVSKWRAFKRKLRLLREEVERCDAFVGKAHEEERAFLPFFLKNRAHPFIDFWQSLIDKLEGGQDVAINTNDIPMWFDPER